MSAPRPFSCHWPMPFEAAIAICAKEGNEAAMRLEEKIQASEQTAQKLTDAGDARGDR